MSALKKVFSKKKIAAAFSTMRKNVPKMRLRTVLEVFAVTLAALVALLVRLLPLRWGAELSEFDPYYHYYVAEFFAERWPKVWEITTWRIYNMWYPYGRQVLPTTPPGLPLTAAVIYLFLRSLGANVTLYDVCVYFPPFMAALTCVAVYFFARDHYGKAVGIFSSLFLAVNSGYITRTYLGFFKHESLGILLIVLVAFLFLRALDERRSFKQTITYAVLAGLTQGYLSVSWTAYLYTLDLIALFVMALCLIGRYDRRILLAYASFVGADYTIMLFTPRTLGRMKGIESVLIILAFLIACVCELSRRIEDRRTKIKVIGGITGTLVVLVLTSVVFGFILMPKGKLLGAINPAMRSPIVSSVAEHRPMTWASLFYDYGILLILACFGCIILLRRLTNVDLFMTLYGITALYFASSMARLTLVLAPAICVLSSIGLVYLVRSFRQIARKGKLPARKLLKRMPSELGWLGIVALFVLLLPTLWRGILTAYTPATIICASVPVGRNYQGEYTDWLEAVAWIRENLPKDAVVACWWDYGYWVSIPGNRTSLADNATINTTQIANIARMFLSEERVAVKILHRYDADYVLVFTTLGKNMMYGDEAKWPWMAQISGMTGRNTTVLVDPDLRKQNLYLPRKEFVITKLIIYTAYYDKATGRCSRYKDIYKEDAPEFFDLVFVSSNNMVGIFEVNYEKARAEGIIS